MIPRLINNISFPALMVWSLTNAFDKDNLLPLLNGLPVAFISMLLCCLAGLLAAKALKVGPGRRGVFTSTFFCSNVVFVGMPVSLTLFGDVGTPYLLLYFFVNNIFLWTVAYYLIGKDGDKADVRLMSRENLRNIVSPPLVGFACAVVLVLAGVRLPDFVMSTAKHLGSMTTSDEFSFHTLCNLNARRTV